MPAPVAAAACGVTDTSARSDWPAGSRRSP